MNSAATLRARAEAQASRLPPLLARAEHLAGTVLLGEHGRRRAGLGDDFWQYRPVQPGDSYTQIDWRRSAQSDASFVRQREWKIAQSVTLWVDQAASMGFSSSKELETKGERAKLLSLALSLLLLRGGERVGLAGHGLPPRRGEIQAEHISAALLDDHTDDYGTPNPNEILSHGRAVFVSDFLGDFDALREALGRAADRGVRGLLLQVLDPAEEDFPFRGRAIFESMGGSLEHETRKADDLRTRYLDRLNTRREELRELARATGWRFQTHRTDASAQSALMWLFHGLEERF